MKYYTSDQMLEIAKTYLKKEDIIATQETLDHLKNYFEDLYKNKYKFFGNARTVRQTVSEAIKNQNLRNVWNFCRTTNIRYTYLIARRCDRV